jgi:5-formyltetrahydrofolate cyclo-ligase
VSIEPPAAEAGKDVWRAWAKERRGHLDLVSLSDVIVGALAGWPALQAARTVLLYYPLEDEVNVTGLIDSSRRWAATRTPEWGDRLTVHELGGPLEVHRFGFLQPHPAAPELDPGDIDLALVPGLAFDLWGTRLGRGAGYFDELLTRTSPRLTTVGVVPAPLVVDRLPSDEHDIHMSFLATEEGVIAVARSG